MTRKCVAKLNLKRWRNFVCNMRGGGDAIFDFGATGVGGATEYYDTNTIVVPLVLVTLPSGDTNTTSTEIAINEDHHSRHRVTQFRHRRKLRSANK